MTPLRATSPSARHARWARTDQAPLRWARDRLAQRLDVDGALNTTPCMARQRSGTRSNIPTQSILAVIRSGRRVPDPQGVAGRYIYRSPASMTRPAGGRSDGTLEVLVNEYDNVIEHVLYRSQR